VRVYTLLWALKKINGKCPYHEKVGGHLSLCIKLEGEVSLLIAVLLSFAHCFLLRPQQPLESAKYYPTNSSFLINSLFHP
jgi:hypothetical protein